MRKEGLLDQALELLDEGEPLYLVYVKEEIEIWQWVISTNGGFWMEAFPNKGEAQKFIEQIGWKVYG